jgi:hypothetical protein
MRVRSALQRMDLDGAARSSSECDELVGVLSRAGAQGQRPRRWARVAARMLSLCHRRVVAEQERTARELEALGRTQTRAVCYRGTGRDRRSA